MADRITVLAAALCAAVMASTSAHAAVDADLVAGATGTAFFNQSFNETRAADVTVLGAANLNLQSMTLREFNVVTGPGGTLGARVYDASSGTLLALGSAAVGAGFDQTLTIPIAATLVAGHTYRVGFFLDVEGDAGSADGLDVSPPGLGLTPYAESTGLLLVSGTFATGSDSFPSTANGLLPLMTLTVTPVPEPAMWQLLAGGLLGAAALRRRPGAPRSAVGWRSARKVERRIDARR
jgi:hypothetical protein